MSAGPVFKNGRQVHPSEVSHARDQSNQYIRTRAPNPARGARRKCCRCGKKFQPSAKLWMMCQHCYYHADRGATVYMDGGGELA